MNWPSLSLVFHQLILYAALVYTIFFLSIMCMHACATRVRGQWSASGGLVGWKLCFWDMASWCAKGEKWPGSEATCTRPGRPLSAQHVLYSPCQRACLFDHASLCVRACVAACEQSIFPLIFYHSKSKYCQLPFLLGKKIVPDCQLPVFFYRCVFIDDQLRGPAHVRAGRQLRWAVF